MGKKALDNFFKEFPKEREVYEKLGRFEKIAYSFTLFTLPRWYKEIYNMEFMPNPYKELFERILKTQAN